MSEQTSASESRFYPGMETNPWKGVEDAVALLRTSPVERIDGPGWKAYKAGMIIRVDIAHDFEVPAIS